VLYLGDLKWASDLNRLSRPSSNLSIVGVIWNLMGMRNLEFKPMNSDSSISLNSGDAIQESNVKEENTIYLGNDNNDNLKSESTEEPKVVDDNKPISYLPILRNKKKPMNKSERERERGVLVGGSAVNGGGGWWR
jgi:hypothetical protein